MSRSTAYRESERDAAFNQSWREAFDDGCDALELEAIRRGMVGVEKPVHLRLGKNAKTGQFDYKTVNVREYSDALLQFVLRAAKPEKYRESAALYAEALKKVFQEAIQEFALLNPTGGMTAEQSAENSRRFGSRFIDGEWVSPPSGGWPAELEPPTMRGGPTDA